MSTKFQAFISYASEDLDLVYRVYEGLKKRNVKTWFDKEDIVPGQWKNQITRAIVKSTHFIVCLSKNALRKIGDKPGFQDEELTRAYEIALSQPASAFTIIPLRLEPCDRGDHRLSTYQQFDVFKDWEIALDKLAVKIGGRSLSDNRTSDQRTEAEKDFERLCGRADAYYYAGDYGKGLKMWEVIEERFGTSSRTMFAKGLGLGGRGNSEAAINSFDDSIKHVVSALINKGSMLEKTGRKEEALGVLEQSTTLEPNSAIAWSSKGHIFEILGRYSDSLKALRKALSLNPEKTLAATAWMNLGVTLSRLKKDSESLEAYKEAILLDPEYAHAWYNKGVQLERQGRSQEAIIAYDKAASLEKDYADPLNNKAVLLGKERRYNEALQAADEAIAREENFAWPHINRSTYLRNLGRLDEALDSASKGIKLEVGNAAGWYNKGYALAMMHRYQEALTAYQEALRLEPSMNYAKAGVRNMKRDLGLIH